MQGQVVKIVHGEGGGREGGRGKEDGTNNIKLCETKSVGMPMR